MANSNTDYKTYVLGSVDALNDCTRIILFNSQEVGALSLQNLEYTLNRYNHLGLILTAEPSEYNDGSDKMFKYRGKTSAESIDLMWGFDIIVYLSPTSSPLGYTKFTSIQGQGGAKLNILPKFTSSSDSGSISIKDINTDLDISEFTEEKKYKDSVVSLSDALKFDPGYIKYSTHITSDKTLFLGGYAVIGSDVSRLSLNNNFYLNIFGHEFEHYFIGYYNEQLALFCWSNAPARKSKYCIISLTESDVYGHPIFYSVSKEGRTFEPEDSNFEDINIEYISGRYLCCTIQGLGDEIRIYDTYRKRWLDDGGKHLMSNPLNPRNNIKRLTTTSALFSDLIIEIPELKEVYLTESDKKKILSVNRFVGRSVVLNNISVGNPSCLVCTPTMQLYLMKSELPDLIFLNESTLVYDNIVYSGIGKTFCTSRYKLEHPKISCCEGKVLNPSKYRRLNSISTVPKGRLIAGFAGILFYKDNKNIVKYL